MVGRLGLLYINCSTALEGVDTVMTEGSELAKEQRLASEILKLPYNSVYLFICAYLTFLEDVYQWYFG